MNLIISTMLLILTNQFSIETPNYKLVKKYKNFEIRDYEKMIVAHTMIKRTFKQSTNTGSVSYTHLTLPTKRIV